MQIEEIAQKVLGYHVFQAGLKDILEDIIGRETIELNCISEQIANQIEDIVERAVENETRHQFVARLKLNYELHNEQLKKMQENFQRQLSELKKEVEEAFSSSKLGLDSKEALYSLKSILIEENIKDSEITQLKKERNKLSKDLINFHRRVPKINGGSLKRQFPKREHRIKYSQAVIPLLDMSVEKDGSKSSERAKPEDTLGTEKAEEDKLDCLNSVNGEWERKLSKKVAVLGSELRAWKAQCEDRITMNFEAVWNVVSNISKQIHELSSCRGRVA